jgi:hypothetical protein
MRCEAFEAVAMDLAREEALDGPGREQALAHARECPRCAARLEDERAVTGALVALAARTETEAAPPRVEWALRRSLRAADGATERRHRVTAGRLVAAVLASAAVLAVAAVLPRGSGPPGRSGSKGTVATPPAKSVPRDGSEFISLNYTEDLRDMDSLDVLRIEMPRTALAAFGWPAGDLQPGVVTADVIVGYDGVARAIRLVE